MKKSEAEEYLRVDYGKIPNTLRYILLHLLKDDWEKEEPLKIIFIERRKQGGRKR